MGRASLSWAVLLLAGLAGCQAAPSRLPEAEPPPAAACRWASPAGLARVVAALEAEGFVIRHTEASLGLVSAERSRRVVFHGAPEPDIFLLGRHGPLGGGVLVGGGLGVLDDEASEIERVSVVVGGATVRVSRDLRLFDWRGELRRARTASDAGFCRELREAIRRRAEEDA